IDSSGVVVAGGESLCLRSTVPLAPKLRPSSFACLPPHRRCSYGGEIHSSSGTIGAEGPFRMAGRPDAKETSDAPHFTSEMPRLCPHSSPRRQWRFCWPAHTRLCHAVY